jgi:FMN-dependent oxidoreductase (nitrilotriacetate monooxygenase family)
MGKQQKKLLLNAFHMCSPSQQWAGMWTHERDQGLNYHSLDYYVELARTAERGLLDGIFFADSIGLMDKYGGDSAEAIRAGAMAPMNDPTLAISAMALVTEHLGFGVTANLTFEHPFIMARRFSTLDHLTKGRMGWNIVAGFVDSGARAIGEDRIRAHDERYDLAEEYMDAVYKLWEVSWDDDAVQRDRAHQVFARPDGVRRVDHEGRYLKMSAVHMCEPSAQRTPVLYQAGASTRGRAFAAKHAECVFLTGFTKEMIRGRVDEIRAQMRLARRCGAPAGRLPRNAPFRGARARRAPRGGGGGLRRGAGVPCRGAAVARRAAGRGELPAGRARRRSGAGRGALTLWSWRYHQESNCTVA